jgi:hypothetical protein
MRAECSTRQSMHKDESAKLRSRKGQSPFSSRHVGSLQENWGRTEFFVYFRNLRSKIDSQKTRFDPNFLLTPLERDAEKQVVIYE